MIIALLNLTYIEFSLFLFGGISCCLFIDLPNFTTTVLITEAFIIDDKVIVTTGNLPLVVLILVKFFEYTGLLLHLQSSKKFISLLQLW